MLLTVLVAGFKGDMRRGSKSRRSKREQILHLLHKSKIAILNLGVEFHRVQLHLLLLHKLTVVVAVTQQQRQ